MDAKYLLHADRQDARRLVFAKLEKSEVEVQKDVEILKNWFGYQKHLPGVPYDNILEIFLIVNKFNLEKCKKKLEMYFTIRTQIPELYVNKNPKLDSMKEIADTVYCIPLPKLTPSLSRITVMKLRDPDPEKFCAADYFAHTYNVIEIRVREDMVLSDTVVYDMKGLKLGHLLKLSPGILKKSAAVFEVHVHEDLESLYKHLPKDLLPQDYGGNVQSLSELHDLWKEKFKENQALFDNLEKLTLKKNEILSEPSVNCPQDFRNLGLD